MQEASDVADDSSPSGAQRASVADAVILMCRLRNAQTEYAAAERDASRAHAAAHAADRAHAAAADTLHRLAGEVIDAAADASLAGFTPSDLAYALVVPEAVADGLMDPYRTDTGRAGALLRWLADGRAEA